MSARVGGRSPLPVIAGLALIGVALLIPVTAWLLKPVPPTGIDPAAVYRVCAQYAGLDLSGMVPLCKAAGYQERVYVQPRWPAGTVQPEDMDRG